MELCSYDEQGQPRRSERSRFSAKTVWGQALLSSWQTMIHDTVRPWQEGGLKRYFRDSKGI